METRDQNVKVTSRISNSTLVQGSTFDGQPINIGVDYPTRPRPSWTEFTAHYDGQSSRFDVCLITFSFHIT